MKLDNQRILELFALLADLDGEKLAPWCGLCESAADKLAQRLKVGVNVAQNMERLCMAAAAWAYGDYLVLRDGDSPNEIKVGDISLKSSPQTSSLREAEDIRAYFMEQIADLVAAPSTFVFRSAECKL